jgi:hypothetical protein
MYLYINTDILGEIAASIFGEVNIIIIIIIIVVVVIIIIIIIADFGGALLCSTFCH